ncbi:hypothetical protein Gasu2_59960 [Galdieria sulphuraria]|uniref:Transcription factor TFIID subunit 8 C-terminal domain-containing protein n=1 Tax=Galdieria sulphuraria TaxID=130081 RepID=M2X9A8_GALSU|nr:uncharacterized protein Gasu_59590 [Galdieria sulphuraria]EME26397.1 hypothetical protein Gasu_59590 [Galdieria sulphuraria]GJD11872.1 hypothetical protein Gasu2_59960 [Galdieria sulphuraria]|eukprot:XP_005702917.1 hypothetical protein Gasu_59590 [Galdieria sulphuraria]
MLWTEDFARQLNIKAILAILNSLFQNHGRFNNYSDEVLLLLEFPVCVFLENAVENFFEEFAQSARAVCEQSGRTVGNWFDIDFVLEKLFGKRLDVSDLLQLAQRVSTGKHPVYKRKRIPANTLAFEERDGLSEWTPRERWMPPLPPQYTYRSHQIYYPTRILRLEEDRQAFLEQKLEVERLLLAEEEWTNTDVATVCNLNTLPFFKKKSLEEDSLEDEKELLEFLFEENIKEQPMKATENIKVDRQLLVQRFERIMSDVDNFIE